MRKLTQTQLSKMDEWMRSNARSFDLAKWNYLFNGGSKVAIVEEIKFIYSEALSDTESIVVKDD